MADTEARPDGMYQEMRVTIPVELLQLIDQAAATREQTRSEVVIEAMYKNNENPWMMKKWMVRLCKTAGCTKSAEGKNGGRMGRCGHHYEEEWGTNTRRSE